MTGSKREQLWLAFTPTLLLAVNQPHNSQGFSVSSNVISKQIRCPTHSPRIPSHNPNSKFSLCTFSTNTDQQNNENWDNTTGINGENLNISQQQSNASASSQKSAKLLHKPRTKKRIASFAACLILACILGFALHQDLRHFIATLDLSGIKLWLQNSLDRLNGAGPLGLVVYALLFCLWTMAIGITTPIETAAGFAFGAKKSILANAFGKFVGAIAAFLLGRYIFFDWARNKLRNNEILQLVQESVTDNPLLVAVMVRFSPLPEPVKNLGMSALDVKRRYFVLSVILHGLPFTLLWSSMGAETAKMVTRGREASKTLKVLVSGTTWFGAILSPTLIGWWLNSLRAKRDERIAQADSNSTDTGEGNS